LLEKLSYYFFFLLAAFFFAFLADFLAAFLAGIETSFWRLLELVGAELQCAPFPFQGNLHLSHPPPELVGIIEAIVRSCQ
jgi:hypothetical protein